MLQLPDPVLELLVLLFQHFARAYVPGQRTLASSGTIGRALPALTLSLRSRTSTRSVSRLTPKSLPINVIVRPCLNNTSATTSALNSGRWLEIQSPKCPYSWGNVAIP
ncbi:hypothetical protein Misp01_71330 [Microtetraspora sp. NBRC 13810]|nr:hypothetical protein Misp01_71330 [Microtetraspora sp. NBRC 13810]